MFLLINRLIFLTNVFIISINLSANYGKDLVKGYTDETLWLRFDMNLWTFWIYPSQKISNENFEISSEKSDCVKAFNVKNSKMIEYLPVKTYEKFPNLVAYQAFNCSLKGIRYENFKNLSELQQVNLAYNQIDFIAPNTFKDLTELEYLSISYNNLIYINDDDFKNLKNLQDLYLHYNQISFVSKNAFGQFSR